jgi:hypothetical protein
MAFQMDCPHCMKRLNVTEKAFGKTVPCPGCNQPLTIPQQPETLRPQHAAKAQVASQRESPGTGRWREVPQQSANIQGAPMAVARPPAAVAPPVPTQPKQAPAQVRHPAPTNAPPPPAAPRPAQGIRQHPDGPAGSAGAQPSLGNGAEADVVRFRCPSCSTVLHARKQLAGKAMACSCGCNIQIPGLPSPSSDGEAPVAAPSTALGSLSLFGVATAVAVLSSFLGTLLFGHG